MLAVPAKRLEAEGGDQLGGAVVSWIEREFGEASSSRFRSKQETLDQARRSSIALVTEESSSSGEALARSTDFTELSTEGEANERTLKALRRYAAELLSIKVRVPDAELSLKSFQSSWTDAWNGSGLSGAKKSESKNMWALLRRKDDSSVGGDRQQQHSGKLALERAAVLFNLACAESAAGASLDRTSEPCVRAACRHFSRAAGLFAYLRKCGEKGRGSSDETSAFGIVEGAKPPRDLGQASLELCEMLMLAQAQACFYEKAIAGGTQRSGVFAKLAAHAATCFWRARSKLPPPPGSTVVTSAPDDDEGGDALGGGAAAAAAESSIVAGNNGSTLSAEVSLTTPPPAPDFVDAPSTTKTVIDPSWAVHLEFQARCFEAATSLWCARAKAEDAEASGSGYGVQLAHLACCASQCTAAIAVAGSPASRVSREAVRVATSLREHATTTYEALKKDNASIYRERVPDFAQLPKVKGHALAKPTPPESWLVGVSGRGPKGCVENAARALDGGGASEKGARVSSSSLRGIVPRAVKSAVVTHVEAAQRASRDAENASLDADDLERAALASLGLPQALDELDDCCDFLTHGALPEPLASRARELPTLDASSSEVALRGAHARLVDSRDKAAESIRVLVESRKEAEIDDSEEEQGEDEASEAARAAVARMLGGGSKKKQPAFFASPASGGDEATELEAQLAAGAKTDAALTARLDDAHVLASLASLDEALDRDHRKATQLADGEKTVFGAEVAAASAACRDALSDLMRNRDERHAASRALKIAADAEAAGAALDRVDALADAGLPLLAVDEPYDEDEEEDGGDTTPTIDEMPPLVSRKLFAGSSRISFCADASRAARLVLDDRYESLVGSAWRTAAGATEKQKVLIDRLATARAAFSTAARRDPAARSARDALARVADGARNFEDLTLSLAEGASFYAELKRRADDLFLNPPRLQTPQSTPPSTVSCSPRYLTVAPLTRQSTLSAPTDEVFRDVPPDYFEKKPVVVTRRPSNDDDLVAQRRRQEEEDEALARELAREEGSLPEYSRPPQPQTNVVEPSKRLYSSPPQPTTTNPYSAEPPPARYSPQNRAPSYSSAVDEPTLPPAKYSPPPKKTSSYASLLDEAPARYSSPPFHAISAATTPVPSYSSPQQPEPKKVLAGEDLVAKILGGSTSFGHAPPSSRAGDDDATRRQREADDLAFALELDRQERASQSAPPSRTAAADVPPSYSGLDAPPSYAPSYGPPYAASSEASYRHSPPAPSRHVSSDYAYGCGGLDSYATLSTPRPPARSSYLASNGDAPPSAFGASASRDSSHLSGPPPTAFGSGRAYAEVSEPPPAFGGGAAPQRSSRGSGRRDFATNNTSSDSPPPAFF